MNPPYGPGVNAAMVRSSAGPAPSAGPSAPEARNSKMPLTLEELHADIIQKISMCHDSLLSKIEKNSKTIEDMGKKLRCITTDMEEMKEAVQTVKHHSTEQEKRINSLEEKMNRLESYERRWNLRLYGVSEEQGENVERKVTEICGLVAPDTASTLHTFIDFCHRLGVLEEGGTRPIIIRFTSRDVKDKVWRATKDSNFLKALGLRFSLDVTEKDKETPSTNNAETETRNMVREFKEEPECRDIQSLKDSTPVLQCEKEEPVEVEIQPEALSEFLHVCVKSEEGEPLSSVLHQTEIEEDIEDIDADEETPSDTDDSEDWTPSAESSTQQTRSEHLHRNNDNEGDGTKKHTCSLCGKDFKRRYELKIHELLHMGEIPFKCSICEKGFSEKSNLNRHMKIHSEEKPFICSVCGKGFKAMACLKRHRATHGGEKLFKCSICGHSFSQKCYLNRHKRLHTGRRPFRCSFCIKTFSEKDLLTKHMSSHTGERPFKCTVCAKDFTRKGALDRHVRVHTGEKPYKCLICAKGFTQNFGLKKHMLRIHTTGIENNTFSFSSESQTVTDENKRDTDAAGAASLANENPQVNDLS